MKINITLVFAFISFTLLAYSGLFQTPPVERIGCTELNGDGCACHSLYEDTTVTVWVEGPETLAVGQTGLYKMFLTGGPAEAGGYNVAGRFGIMSIDDTLSVWDYRAPNELTQAFPLPFPTPQDTIFWPFEYTATDSFNVDTIYSCGLSIVYDFRPDSLDRWAYGPKFPLTIIDNVTPVELISFTVNLKDGNAILNWNTATELNNKGFEIQKNNNGKWNIIGFVDGKGTTSNASGYNFIDKNLSNIKNLYRLKQVDFNGTYRYSGIVELNSPNAVFSFELNQNFPNPFNPATKISFEISDFGFVSLKVYDILGNEVANLINEEKPSGKYTVEFDAASLSSGLYLYKLQAGKYSQTKKMVLLK